MSVMAELFLSLRMREEEIFKLSLREEKKSNISKYEKREIIILNTGQLE